MSEPLDPAVHQPATTDRPSGIGQLALSRLRQDLAELEVPPVETTDAPDRPFSEGRGVVTRRHSLDRQPR